MSEFWMWAIPVILAVIGLALTIFQLITRIKLKVTATVKHEQSYDKVEIGISNLMPNRETIASCHLVFSTLFRKARRFDCLTREGKVFVEAHDIRAISLSETDVKEQIKQAVLMYHFKPRGGARVIVKDVKGGCHRAWLDYTRQWPWFDESLRMQAASRGSSAAGTPPAP